MNYFNFCMRSVEFYFYCYFISSVVVKINADSCENPFQTAKQLSVANANCPLITKDTLNEKVASYVYFNVYYGNSQYQYPISGTDFYNDPMKFINCSTPTIFLVGGYTSDMGQDPLYVATKSDPKTYLKDVVQSKGYNFTVVAINWGTLGISSCPYVRNSDIYVPKMGSMLADIFNSAFKGCLSNVWTICHSLGAHMCGIACKKAKEHSDGDQCGRTTALDPAGFLYTTSNSGISRDNAAWVEQYSTNPFGPYGTALTLSAINIFVNSKTWFSQPNCNPSFFAILTGFNPMLCNHSFVWYFFASLFAGTKFTLTNGQELSVFDKLLDNNGSGLSQSYHVNTHFRCFPYQV